MTTQLAHNKLHVYRRALEFVSWKESVLRDIDDTAVVLDHLDRAAESIVEAIANGNSRRSENDRGRYFDVAVGSALECAACLDICECKQLIPRETQREGKKQLQHIVRMTIGLKNAKDKVAREKRETYLTEEGADAEYFFAHESLQVYQQGLELAGWLDGFLRRTELPTRYASGLDKATTSFVLNIAEGNGRFCRADHRKFLDIAHTSVMNAASRLDLLVAKGCVSDDQIAEGKTVLGKLLPLVFGLRDYLNEAEKGEG